MRRRWDGFCIDRGAPNRGRAVTDGLALWIGIVIVGVIAADLFVFGWDLHVFIGRRLDELIEYVAFWR